MSPDERFPAQLAVRLRNRGLEVGEPDIVARTGWTTDELWSVILSRELQAVYDLVTLLIGVNNQYRGGDTATYRTEFVQLLERAIHYGRNDPLRVIVVSIPDWGVTPFAAGRKSIGTEIDSFNAVNRVETLRLAAHYVNITPISRQAQNDPALIAGDGLHPSGKMYAQWVEVILPIAEGILLKGSGS